MSSTYTKIAFTDAREGGITAVKLNKLRDDLSTAISSGTPGAGDMTKAVYDTNANGKVDTCDSLAWTSVTGKPATFPPDSTAMLKSVYDTNGDNIVDQAAAVPWAGITGKPATFPPDATAELVARKGAANGYPSLDATTLVPIAQLPAPTSGDATATQLAKGNDSRLTNARIPTIHAMTHLDNGSDPIAVVTATRTGLAPILSGNAATYLNGTGAYSAVSGSVNPGMWTNLSLGSGWTAPTQAQYRVEVNGTVSTVHFRGMIQAAYSALGTTAFTAPAGAQPSMTRSCVLGGAQATGTPSDVASYLASVAASGVCTIYFLGAGSFVWADPAQNQQVYLDGLSYSL